METPLLVIAVLLGSLLVVLACWHRKRTSDMRSHAETIERQLRAAERELRVALGKLEEANRRAQELIDKPPLPADRHLAGHLITLESRLIECAERLENSRLLSAEPLQRAGAEADKSRTEERKRRFRDFTNTLAQANVGLSSSIDRLIELHPHIGLIASSLRANELAPDVGLSNVAAIDAVLKQLAQEDWLDDDYRGLLHRQTEEYRFRLKSYDRGKGLDRRQRDEERTAASLAFSRHKLPPLTPLDKFRSLRSAGQRDSFGS